MSVLDFGIAGGISLLYPVQGANKKLAAGRSHRIGVRPGEEIDLFIPSGLPFGGPAGGPVEGTELVKVFATTEEADFSPLFQEGYLFAQEARRGAKPGPLGILLEGAMEGGGLREFRSVLHSPGADWTAVTKSFLMRTRPREQGGGP